MHFFFAIWKRNRWNLPLFGEFSVVICIKTLGLKRSSPSIYRSYPEEDHNLVAPLSGDLMIFYYIALYFFFFVVLGGVQLHQPLIARGVVNTERQTQARTSMHIQCESIFTPPLASGPTDSWLLLQPGSRSRTWSAGTNEMSPFAKLLLSCGVRTLCSGIHNVHIISQTPSCSPRSLHPVCFTDCR